MITYIGVNLSDLGTMQPLWIEPFPHDRLGKKVSLGPMDDLPYAFIVRISAKAVDSKGNISAWHGYIESVENRQRMYFSRLESISCFIQEQVDLPSTQALPRWRSLWKWVRNGFKPKIK